jgi:hypothetical protein
MFAGRGHSAETLRGLDTHTLADIGIEHVGQGPATLEVAMTDTGRLKVNTTTDKPRAA